MTRRPTPSRRLTITGGTSSLAVGVAASTHSPRELFAVRQADAVARRLALERHALELDPPDPLTKELDMDNERWADVLDRQSMLRRRSANVSALVDLPLIRRAG